MYQLKSLINKLEENLKEFNIFETIDIKTCNEAKYQFQINNLVKHQRHKQIKDIISSTNKIIKEEDIVSSFEVTDKNFLNLEINIKKFQYTFENIRKAIKLENKKNIILDYGGPNIGKPLHVGHLRSLNIGRSIYEINKLAGNKVTSDIHLGDWGMPIAQIIGYMSIHKIDSENITIEELEKIYPLSSSLYSEDEEFRESALQINKKLNESDKETIQQWSVIRQVSIKSITQVLEILGHKFDLILGESDVNYLIPEMLESLLEKKKITEDSGAYVVSLNTDPKILITKSDGSYLYLTTDLATVINRKSQNFDTVLYVVDKRQSLHFNQLFQCVEYFGIDNADFQHIAFGTVNDSLGNPFKTREGGTKKLIDLFDETKDYIKDINKKLSDSTVNILANTILTYSDLITNRKTDYKFDLEKFSNISGKTGIYVQYALVRAKTLFHKSELKLKKEFYTTKLDEKDLSLIHSLMKFEIYFEQSLNNSEPHHLADYLYELSNLYNSMYQSDNILENNDKEITNNKLLITSYFIDYSILLMESLGISPVDKM
jgi:arginyl-tRNA synthetase|tara:strand:- start:591 stop:2228 length:1638 start_codon:yes stop_codon:yes gene_type:complete